MKKSYIILMIFSVLSITLCAQTATGTLAAKAEKVFATSYFDTASVSVSLVNLSTGEQIYSLRDKALHRPASNMKVLTSCAGLLFLGPDYRFETIAGYDSAILSEGSIGNLVVRGGFDPDVMPEQVTAFTQMIINSLLPEGKLQKISGDIIADVSLYGGEKWGNGWMWDDDLSTDQPVLTSLNSNKNVVTLAVRYNDSLQATEFRVTPSGTTVTVVNKVTSGEKTSLQIERNKTAIGEVFTVTGFAANNNRWYYLTVPVEQPELLFVALVHEELKKAGVAFDGKLRVSHQEVAVVRSVSFSQPFSAIIQRLNKVSDNLNAEMTLLALSKKYEPFLPARSETGMNFIDSLLGLAAYPSRGYRLVDGSGVSHYNMVSAKMLTDVLKYMYYAHSGLYEKLHESLPIAGVDGTLRNRMRGTAAENNVRAKTGTLSAVSSLSGYLKDRDGNMYCFSIMTENFPGSSAIVRKYQDEFCAVIASFSEKEDK